MPAIRGVYDIHPKTLVPGLWFDLSTEPGPGIVGRATTTLAALIPVSGTDEEKRAGFEAALNEGLRLLCVPARGDRFRPINITVSVRSVVSTIVFSNIEVDEFASKSVRVI